MFRTNISLLVVNGRTLDDLYQSLALKGLKDRRLVSPGPLPASAGRGRSARLVNIGSLCYIEEVDFVEGDGEKVKEGAPSSLKAMDLGVNSNFGSGYALCCDSGPTFDSDLHPILNFNPDSTLNSAHYLSQILNPGLCLTLHFDLDAVLKSQSRPILVYDLDLQANSDFDVAYNRVQRGAGADSSRTNSPLLQRANIEIVFCRVDEEIKGLTGN
ncbi:hypothetical protein EVAR_21128_1 [Eumeta japonica]|uniref:Uncharacterized protein n=1 Tax=Eumeta variegata TaxID=151549 RepID=A0A4C1VW51_EUMVA|nr:hypothetical protein EVAR_21128_1 [Eumeta japonica]